MAKNYGFGDLISDVLRGAGGLTPKYQAQALGDESLTGVPQRLLPDVLTQKKMEPYRQALEKLQRSTYEKNLQAMQEAADLAPVKKAKLLADSDLASANAANIKALQPGKIEAQTADINLKNAQAKDIGNKANYRNKALQLKEEVNKNPTGNQKLNVFLKTLPPDGNYTTDQKKAIDDNLQELLNTGKNRAASSKQTKEQSYPAGTIIIDKNGNEARLNSPHNLSDITAGGYRVK
jgi:hypothetical protein